MPSISKFYLHDAATADTGTLPGSSAISATAPTTTSGAVSTDRAMDGVIGSLQTSDTLNTSASTSLQKARRLKWVSSPLAAQTISAQNWTFRIAGSETNTNSNMFFALVIAVWRPSTGALVGRIYDGPNLGAQLGTEPGTSETAEAVMTVSGSAITVQAGDILVVEVWTYFTQSMATQYSHTIYYDGGTEGSATDQAAYVAPTTAISMFVPPAITPTTTISATSTVGGSITPLRPIAPDTTVSATSTVSGSITAVSGGGDVAPSSGVLDAFSYGATAGALSALGPWASVGGIASNIRYADHGAGTINPSGSICADYFTTATYGPDCEAILDIVSVSASATNIFRVLARMQNPGSATLRANYQVAVTAGGTWSIQKVSTTTTTTTIGSTFTQAIAAGDKIAIQCVGSSIKAWWYNGSNGTWNLIGKVTDTDITAAGNLGIVLQGNATDTLNVADNFAGGTLVASGPKPITPTTISATSTVSGSILRVKRLTPTTVSATSTVSGNVGAPRRITTTTVSATSTVSGSIQRLKRITTTTVSATSTVSGNVGAPRRIVTTTITATSTVAGSIRVIRRVAPTTISATSTVSGGVGVTKRITTTTVSATSTVSGTIGRVRRILATTISATSTVSGSIVVIKQLHPTTVSATSTVSGSVAATKLIRPTTVSATSTVSGNVTKIARITPTTTISAISTVSGAILRLRPITPTTTIAATSTVSGALRVTRKITTTTISAISTVSGSIRIGGKISGAVISATSTVTGTVVVRRRIPTTTILATSTVTGAIRVTRRITTTTIAATSTVAGAVRRLRPVAPTTTVLATSTVTGNVRVTRAVVPTTTIFATSVVTGDIVVKLAIPATTIFATSTVDGAATKLLPVVPTTIDAISTVSGTVTGRPPGTKIAWATSGTVTKAKTGRIAMATRGETIKVPIESGVA